MKYTTSPLRICASTLQQRINWMNRVLVALRIVALSTVLGPAYERLKAHLNIKGLPLRWLSKPLQYAWMDEEVLQRLGSDGKRGDHVRGSCGRGKVSPMKQPFLAAIALALAFVVSAHAQAQDAKPTSELGKPAMDPAKPALPEQPPYAGGTLHVICSSHNDLGWQGNPQWHFAKSRELIRQALKRMRENPDYRFNLEMGLSLHNFLSDPGTRPEEKEETLKACREHRLAVGAAWTQPPESSLADEPLARNFLIGRRWLQSQGIESTVYWSEDVPGRALQTPQLCQRAGIKYLMFSRHRHGLQRWLSPDGSSVIAWSPWGGIYASGLDHGLLREGVEQVPRVLKDLQGMASVAASRHAPADPALLFSVDECPPQNADGLIKTWNTAYPGGPTMQYSTAAEFLDKATASGDIPKNYGEQPDHWMYEFHPGHRRSYEVWRRAGEWLPVAETWAALDALTSNDWLRYPKARFDAAWQDVLTMDHAWHGGGTDKASRGGKIDVDTRKIWQRALDVASDVKKSSLEAIASRVRTDKPKSVVVFNALNTMRSDAAMATLPAGGDPARIGVVDADGKSVPCQVAAEGGVLCFVARDVPGLGWATYRLVDREPVATAPAPSATTWENARLKVAFGKGGLTSLIDKTINRELLNPERYAAGEFCSMDTTGEAASDAGVFGGPKAASEVLLGSCETTWRTLEHGPVRSVFRLEGTSVEGAVSVDVVCWNELPRVDLVVRLKNLTIAKGRELRVAIPVAIPGAAVRYGVPFGFVQMGKDDLDRAPGWSYNQISRETTMREANRWISVADEKGGLAIGTSELVFDSRDPKRALGYPVIMPLLIASVLESEKGDFEARFSLCPVAGAWTKGWREAYASQTPFTCISVPTVGKGTLPPRFAPLTIEGPGLLVTALKRAEDSDSLVARVVEMERGTSVLRMAGPIASAEEVDLLEQNPKPLAANKGKVTMTVNPAEIRTVRIQSKTP